MKILMVVAMIVLLAGCESESQKQHLYAAWCKLYDRHDIAIDEWQALRENYMLPGGDVKRAVDAANAAQVQASMATTMTIMNSGNSSR